MRKNIALTFDLSLFTFRGMNVSRPLRSRPQSLKQRRAKRRGIRGWKRYVYAPSPWPSPAEGRGNDDTAVLPLPWPSPAEGRGDGVALPQAEKGGGGKTALGSWFIVHGKSKKNSSWLIANQKTWNVKCHLFRLA